MRRLSIAAAVVALIAAVTIPAATAAPKVALSTVLTGANEVPGPGDPNGRGTADVIVRKSRTKICFAITFRRIEPPTAGHIHRGLPDDAGPVRVTLFEDEAGLPVPGAVDGCVGDLRRKLVRRIARHPERFYVNLHNDEYPDGAIRGQLERAT